jgi:DNA-directed RNA polymerase sigma subunit (sigma70/sigma32)
VAEDREALATRDAKLVADYKGGDKQALNQLIRNHMDLLIMKARRFDKAPVPYPAVLGQAMQLTAVAAKKYDPDSDVRFRTFLEHYLRGLRRYVDQNKRVDRVPEHRLLQVNRYMSQKALLQARQDREPSNQELAEALGWSVTEVQQMEKVLNQRSLAASGLENVEGEDAAQSRFAETVELSYVSWSPEEQLVYDYSVGAHGKPQLRSVPEIAKTTGLSTDAVYRIKRKLAKQLGN